MASPKEIRVIQLIDSLEPGGAERMAVTIANGLLEEVGYSGLVTTRLEGGLRNTINQKVGYAFLNKKKAIDFSALLRLRTFVKINKVNNLTDARYFAAMGVDYLGFCCNTGTELYCSPSKIKEITDWVQGPTFVMELDGWQSEEEVKTVIDSGMAQAIHFGAFATYTESYTIPIFKDYILENIADADFEGVTFPVIRTDKINLRYKRITSFPIYSQLP